MSLLNTKRAISRMGLFLLVLTFRYKLSNLPLKSSSSSFSWYFLRKKYVKIGNPDMMKVNRMVNHALAISEGVSMLKNYRAISVLIQNLR